MVILFQEYMTIILFQAATSCVKIPEWGQDSSSYLISCLDRIFVTIWRTRDQANENPDMLVGWSCGVFSNITDCMVQQQFIVITWRNTKMRLVRSQHPWNDCCSGRWLILPVPQQIIISYGVVVVYSYCIYSSLSITGPYPPKPANEPVRCRGSQLSTVVPTDKSQVRMQCDVM